MTLLRLTVLSLALSAVVLAQVTVTFQDGVSPTAAYAGTRDAMLYSEAGLCWNPTESCRRAVLNLDASPANEAALIRFDVSSIPTGATVTAASLTLYVLGGSTHAYKYYESLRPWVPTQATWMSFATGSPWQTAGSQGALDKGTTLIGQVNVASSGVTTVLPMGSAGLTLVQSWVSTPAKNHGLAFVDFASSDALQLASSLDTNPTHRPRLDITYTNGGPVTPVGFQDGVAPTAAYAGETDVMIGSGPDPDTRNYPTASSNLYGSIDPYGTVIQFDLTAVPPWATVRAAALTVQLNQAGGGTYPASALLRPWVETEVSWGHASASVPWAAPGAVGATDTEARTLVTLDGASLGENVMPFGTDGVQVVQEWVSGARQNNGVLFHNYDASIAYVTSLRTREDSTPELRPSFSVTYVEGTLGFVGLPASTPPGVSSSPVRVRRQSLAGAPVAAGAPELPVSLAADGSGELASSADGPWASALSTVIPAGSSESLPFTYRNARRGTGALLASSTPAWQNGTASLEIGATATLDDAGSRGPATSSRLQVGNGCSTSSADQGALSASLILLAVWAARRCRAASVGTPDEHILRMPPTGVSELSPRAEKRGPRKR